MNKSFLCMGENGENEGIYWERESGVLCKEVPTCSVSTLFDIEILGIYQGY